MKNSVLVCALVGLVALSVAPVFSDGESGPGPEEIRDRAISKTVAWRPKSAETILRDYPDHEKTQPYLTAEAFLMAAYSVGQDDKLVGKALEILTTQANKDRQDPVSEFYRGQVLAWMDQKDKAQKAWQNAKQRAEALVKKNSRDGRAQYYLGASLVMLRQPAEARKALKKAFKADWDQPMVDFQTGLSYLLQENWKAAKSSFDDVHELDPRYAHLYFYRGLAWDKLGEKDRLLDDLDQFVKLAPNSPEAKTANAILKR